MRITKTIAFVAMLSTSVWAKDKDADVFRAMRDEQQRSLKELTLPNAERPYFIEYTITDLDTLSISASFGALAKAESKNSRYLKVDLRIGDPSLDQTNFDTDEASYSYEMFASGITPENNYDVLRHDLWEITDEAYKASVEIFGRKKAFLGGKSSSKEKIPSFSSAPPVQQENALPIAPALDQAGMQDLAKHLSALFKGYKDISNSSVNINAVIMGRHYLNTEGTQLYDQTALLQISVNADAQADDGAKLHDQLRIYVNAAMPKTEDLDKAVKGFADDFVKMRGAKPLDDDFTVPVVFEGQAAGQLLRELMTLSLSGTPAPLGSRGAKQKSLDSRIGKEILPPFLSLEDDPTASSFGGQALIGGYKTDDEGVIGQKVLLADKGQLKTLLSSRIPSKKMPASNGHGRGSLSYRPQGRPSNLFLRASKPEKNLLATAQKEAKAEQAPFVLVVRSLATAGSQSLEDYFGGDNQQDEDGITTFYAYKLYPDGKEEPVRGFSLQDIDLNAIRDIKAAGSDASVYQYVVGLDADGIEGIENGIPTSIIAPSLLFTEVNVKATSGANPKPPALPHPYFAK